MIKRESTQKERSMFILTKACDKIKPLPDMCALKKALSQLNNSTSGNAILNIGSHLMSITTALEIERQVLSAGYKCIRSINSPGHGYEILVVSW